MSLAPEIVVRALMQLAGLPLSEAEVAELVASYPEHRARLDELWTVPLDDGDERKPLTP